MKGTKDFDLNSFTLAMYLSITMLMRFITWILPFENANVIAILALFVIFILFNLKKFKFTKKFIIINVIVLLNFLYSFLIVTDIRNTFSYFLNYCLYGAMGMFILQYVIDYKKVFNYINNVFFLFTIVLTFYFIPMARNMVNLDFTMDLSYAAVIGFTATFINLRYDKSVAYKFLSVLCLAINLYYLFLLNNNRGSILALLFFFVIYYTKNIRKFRNRIIIFSSIMVASLIFFNVGFNMLANMKTDINWIVRLQYQIRINNISSSRNILYSRAIEKIDSSPFFGLGIGGFENSNNGVYVHNLFLQIACENGLFYTIIIGIVLCTFIFKTIFYEIKSEKDLFLIFLLVQFIPRLLISSVHWINSFIWIYLYYCLEKNIFKQYNYKNGLNDGDKNEK